MSSAPLILIADDEAPIRKLVDSYLRAEGWDVITAANGEQAVKSVRDRRPDLVVLDVLMPELDGLEALRQIRTFSDVYVIMLTARSEEADKLVGLGVGADDYLTKPFSPRELVARMKAVFRRVRSAQPTNDAVIAINGIEIDKGQRLVRVLGEEKELTALEFDILVALAEQPGRVFSRQQLLERAWGWDYYSDERVVDVHIRNLRKALGDNASDPTWVATVRGVGYRLLGSSE